LRRRLCHVEVGPAVSATAELSQTVPSIGRGTFSQIERIAFFATNNELGAPLVGFAGSILKCGKFLSSLRGMQQSFHVIGHIWLDDADGSFLFLADYCTVNVGAVPSAADGYTTSELAPALVTNTFPAASIATPSGPLLLPAVVWAIGVGQAPPEAKLAKP